jgi:hypothetical protein
VSLRGATLQVFVEQLFPRRSVEYRGVGDDAVKIEEDGVEVSFCNDNRRGRRAAH